MATLTRSAAGSQLFVPSDRGANPVTAGYLLPTGAATPDNFGLQDALSTYPGWFVMLSGVSDAGIPAFEQSAQSYFANPARAGALAVWFTNAANASTGLTGFVMYAPRPDLSLIRTAQIAFANFAIILQTGAKVAVSGDGTALTITVTGSAANSLSVTPFGQRQPVQIPMTGAASLSILGAPELAGCLQFGLTLTQNVATSLDLGLRSFTAPVGGGNTNTARYQLFDFSGLAGGTPISAVVDPLAPLDHQRSHLTFDQSGLTLPSAFRNPVGATLRLTAADTASLVFANRLTAVDANGNPVILPSNQILYMVPSGDFTLNMPAASKAAAAASATPDLTANLMCGLSAVEYLSLATGTTLSFVPDQAAFAPTLKAAGTDNGRVFGALTSAGSTAWVQVKNPQSSSYSAQPNGSVLFQGQSTMLSYLPLELGKLDAASAPATPLLPYATATVGSGLTREDLAQFEAQVWSPQRRGLLQKAIDAAGPRAFAAGGGTLPNPPYGTTPQGLLLHFGQDTNDWAEMTLAVSSTDSVPVNRDAAVVLESVTDDLQAALQTNQLFLVATGADLFMSNAQMAYLLNNERLGELSTVIPDQDVISRLKTLLTAPTYTIRWANEAAMNTSLHQVLTADQYDSWHTTIRDYCGELSLFVAGWEFNLSPWRWIDHKTILIFKFCSKQLTQLVEDTSQWASPDAFNPSKSATQQALVTILQDAAASYQNGDTDFAYFVNTVMRDPNWNGVLALNALVPLSGLPPQMEGIAAGIDPSQFQAHHLGITTTPIQTGANAYTAQPSSAFGLIYYQDDSALTGTDPYMFKVSLLKVLLANSEVTSFSSTIKLLVNQLFGEPCSQRDAPDNVLELDGTYQDTGGLGSYSFVTSGSTIYQINSRILYQLLISQASFVTLNDDDTTAQVTSQFQITGSLSFLAQSGFDLFSYGPEQAIISANGSGPGLAFSSLAIDMDFNQATPSYKTFAFDASTIALDASASLTRLNSLVAHFPLKLAGLIQSTGTDTPDSLGFMPVDSPLQGSQLASPWFGLQFDMDLGSPGALAAQIGFTARVLLGWAPNLTTPTLYIGLSLPGVSGGQRAISLEGVLSLAFGDVTFIVQAPTYILQFSNIALKFLSLTFPPNGQINMVMFGNPNAETSGALGWYAAYVKNGSAGGGSGNSKPPSRLFRGDRTKGLFLTDQTEGTPE